MSELQSKKYILPAEWSRQAAVQLTWPHADTDWRPYLDDITEVCLRLVEAIAGHERVIVVAQDAAEVSRLIEQRIGSVLMKNVIVHRCNNNDTWARDHAFITVEAHDECGGADHLMLDFRFNGWGEKFPANLDNKINATLYNTGMFSGHRVDYDDFVLEGGSVESDGRGTIFTTSMCLLAPHRNQPLGRSDIEQILKERLFADRVVWLDHGQLIGDDTDGHIDTIVRTAPDNTLVYVGCDDPEDSQYADFKALENQLMALRTADGHPFRLLRLPMPDAIYDEGERLPATYANYLIINDAVIVPVYGQPDNDKAATDIISQAYPGRQMICIDARVVIRQHGSLHCLTMQYPEGCLALDAG